MVIQHNLLANFTERQFGINTRSKNKALEKLSSGYRINRAADDAAGLYISEKMRGQIRGLNQGARNVTDGISMINTAEGAIGEQVDILQRIRVLTIEAYNDTYTQEDREAIQMEVDGLLKEVDRIAKDTEFNTIKVLQGPKEIVRTEIVEPSEEYSERSYTFNVQREFPAWTNYDKKLELNNNKVSANTVQDTSQYIIFNENRVVDPDMPSTAYGPKPMLDDGTVDQDKINKDGWQDEWSQGLDNNYSAVVDFSAIANATTVDELYNYLSDLAGTGIGYECSTCNVTQGVCFQMGDEVKVNRVYNSERSDWFPAVDLIGFREEIDGLGILSEDLFNDLSDAQKADRGITAADYDEYIAAYADSVKKVAESIAEGIVNAVIGKTQYKEHFVRTVKNAGNQYQVVFYDFRDDGVTGVNDLAGNVLDNVSMSITTKVMVENNPMEFTSYEESDYWIQIGANSHQGVFIEFPDTSLAAIGLEDYTVFPYGYCSATKDNKYDPAFMVGAWEIGENLYRKRVSGEPGTIIEETRTISGVNVIKQSTIVTIPGTPAGTDKNGEYVPAKPATTKTIVTGEKEVPYSYTITIKREVGGTPGGTIDFYAYPPDSLLRIDKAINSLSESRSRLGAYSNRLEHAYLNDLNASENLQYSESRIRDANIADDAVALARDNILEQAGIAMLAQANQASDGVLQLLR